MMYNDEMFPKDLQNAYEFGMRFSRLKYIWKENIDMNPLEIMKSSAAYASGYENTPAKEQARAKQLCCYQL